MHEAAIIQFFAALGRSYETMKSIAATCRANERVSSAMQQIWIYQLEHGFRATLDVGAELKNGDALSWWLEVTGFDAMFSLEAGIARNDAQGWDMIDTLMETTCTTSEECMSHMNEAASKLSSSVSAILDEFG